MRYNDRHRLNGIGDDIESVLNGEALEETGWDDITAPLIARRLEGTQGTLQYDYVESSVKMQISGSMANSQDVVMLNIQKPHKMVATGEFRLHLHWEQVSPDDGVEFKVSYRVQKNGQPKTLTWSDVITIAADATTNVFECPADTTPSAPFNQITNLCVIDLSDAYLSSTVQIKVTRSDATVFTGEVDYLRAVFLDCHYPTDQPAGSREEFVK